MQSIYRGILLKKMKPLSFHSNSTTHCMKSVQMQSYLWSVFPVFGLNTEIYGVNLSIQSEYRKIRTRNNSVFGHFSCSDWNCNPNQNIWNKANKSSKIGQDKKTLISAFAQLFNHYCQSFVFRRQVGQAITPPSFEICVTYPMILSLKQLCKLWKTL